jgi:excisionase family DNA binding protein
MNQRIRSATAEQLLSVEAVAERLDTKPRFIRRLIAERRIEYHKVGRHVRISESALTEFIEAGRVVPLPARRRGSAALWRGSGVSGGSVSCRRVVGRHATEDRMVSIDRRREHSSRRPAPSGG